MKKATQPMGPRIVTVATEIAKTQARRTVIDKRLGVLETEQMRLEEEDETLTKVQAGLQREMDKLSSPSVVQL